MEARFHLTARVFAGCTMHHPMQPPIPEVVKMTDLERGGGCEEALDVANIDKGVGIIFYNTLDKRFCFVSVK